MEVFCTFCQAVEIPDNVNTDNAEAVVDAILDCEQLFNDVTITGIYNPETDEILYEP